MRVIFMGTPDFAVPTLNALVGAGHEVVLVVAQPDQPVGRGRVLTAPPVAARAGALGLPLAQPRALRSGPFPERFRGLGADVAVVLAYGRILPLPLLQAPRLGCVNVHASLLPRWRGAAPIQAALLAGDLETGVCTQQMEEGLDTGPVFLEARTALAPRETAGTLHDRLAAMSAEIAVQTLSELERRTPTPQGSDGVCWAPKIEKADGRVDWALPAEALDRRVRAMTPWPGGWTPLAKGPLRLARALPVEGAGAPGEVLSLDPLVVACGEGALALERVVPPGRKEMDGASFARGQRLTVGELLGGDAWRW
ncbi:MAG: methionyl-tRNA formyltransferase [Deltaproteobacteria bacterium]|nr:methionyl-tRNA formyltransferase [Deltaproteobacteria bacterium]